MKPNFNLQLHFNKNKYDCKKGYINKICSFDIEVSSFLDNDEKRSIMYLYGLKIENEFVIGRNWVDFKKDIKHIIEIYNVSLKNKIVFYVHNLSYEFQFIRKLFKWQEVFIMDDRKICKAVTIDGVEFRCSYILTNYKLEKLVDCIIGYKGKKLVGELDYKKTRHPKTKLYLNEIEYLYYDCDIVYNYIKQLIEKDGYYFNDIPNTSTSFVRKTLEKNKRTFSRGNILRNLNIKDGEQYIFIRKSFVGGYTHANYNKVNKTLYNIDSFDITSSYPYTCLVEKFPMESPKEYTIKSKEDFLEKINNYYCIFEIEFTKFETKINQDNYISLSKATYIDKYRTNNGRILYADTIRLIINEVDFYIISKTYKWKNITIGKFLYGKKSYLPTYFILTILKYYNDKTKLKDIKEYELEYMHAKNEINALYGCMVTDIIREEILYINDDYINETPDIDKLINIYNKKNKSLWYLWGLYVTSYARKNLWDMILVVGDDYCYSDTDSIKCEGNHLKDFEEYNKNVDKRLKFISELHDIPLKLFYPKNKNGKTKVIGYFNYEGKYNMFKTLGAKRYMFVKNGELEITISGVNKKNGKDYLLNKYKTFENIFDNFDDNLIFPSKYIVNENNKEVEKSATGKMTLYYIDSMTSGVVNDYNGKSYKYNEPSGIYMEGADYSLKLEYTFLLLLKGRYFI